MTTKTINFTKKEINFIKNLVDADLEYYKISDNQIIYTSKTNESSKSFYKILTTKLLKNNIFFKIENKNETMFVLNLFVDNDSNRKMRLIVFYDEGIILKFYINDLIEYL